MTIDRAYETMMDVFRKTNPDGSYFFSDADVKRFLPWMIMRVGVDLETLDEAPLLMFAQACATAGVTAGLPPEEVQAKFDAHYAAAPLHPELMRAFEAAFRDVNAGGSGEGGGFAKFAGEAASRNVLQSGKRPEGTIPAGPMARFQVKPK